MGWPEDFSIWSERAVPLVLGRLISLFGDRGLAEEATQVAFEKAISKRVDRHYFPSYEQFVRWIVKVAKNEVLQTFRQKRKFVPMPGELYAEPDGPSNVWFCLQKLDEDCKRLLISYYYDHMTDQDIAAQLSVSVTEAWRRRRKALAALRQVLLADGLDPENWEFYPDEPVHLLKKGEE